MKLIIKMKLELKYFSPYFKIIRPEKLLLFQLSQNSSQNASKQTHPPHVVFIQRILTLLFTYTIDPETYGIAIRTRKKKKRKGKGKKKEKGMERKGADLRFRFVPLRSSIWRRGTRARYMPTIHHTPRAQSSRNSAIYACFDILALLLFPFSSPSVLPLLFVNWHRQDIRRGSRVKRHSRYR